MKKISTLLLLLLFIGANSITAAPYKADFNSSIDTSDHAFKPAQGWGHIVDGFQHPIWSWMSSFTEYTYVENGGVDGSGALRIGSQDGYNDLLVTPAVTGTASIMVKAIEGANPESSIRFFNVEGNERGEELSIEVPALSTSQFVKVEIPNCEAQKIGIRGENIIIDDFEADEAAITLATELKVTGIAAASDMDTWSEIDGFFPKTYISVDSEGNYTLSYDVTLTNTGDIDLKPGDENYTVAFINCEDDAVIGEPMPITESIAAGETKTINFKKTLNINEYPGPYYMGAIEYISGTSVKEWLSATPKSNSSVEPEENAALTITNAVLTTPLNDGKITADENGNFTIRYDVTIQNTGEKTLTPGMQGYTITISDSEAFFNNELGSVMIDQTLAAGESATVPIQVTVNLNDHPDVMGIVLIENITSTTYVTEDYITAEIPYVEKRELTVSGVKFNGEKYLDYERFSWCVNADENGDFTISYDVTVMNTGNIDLKADDEGMSVSLFDGYKDTPTPIVTVPLNTDLAAGESTTVTITAQLNVSDYPETVWYCIMENVSSSKADGDFLLAVVPEAPVTEEEITITNDLWASYSSDYALDFSTTEGLTAYVVTAVNGNVVKLEEVTSVPAGTGILLHGNTAGTYTVPVVEAAEEPSVNYLVGTGSYAVSVGGMLAIAPYGSTYAFGKNKDGVIGFVKASDGYIIGAHKAFLKYESEIEDDDESLLFMAINPETNGLQSVEASVSDNAPVYNLSGQKVGNSYKGIIIRNGKKYINK